MENEMTDQCKYCELRGNIKECLTPKLNCLSRAGAEVKMNEVNNLSALLYAETDDGVKGVIREHSPQHMKMDDGRYFIPLEDDAGIARLAAMKLIEAIDNHYPDSPEFASLYADAQDLLGI